MEFACSEDAFCHDLGHKTVSHEITFLRLGYISFPVCTGLIGNIKMMKRTLAGLFPGPTSGIFAILCYIVDTQMALLCASTAFYCFSEPHTRWCTSLLIRIQFYFLELTSVDCLKALNFHFFSRQCSTLLPTLRASTVTGHQSRLHNQPIWAGTSRDAVWRKGKLAELYILCLTCMELQLHGTPSWFHYYALCKALKYREIIQNVSIWAKVILSFPSYWTSRWPDKSLSAPSPTFLTLCPKSCDNIPEKTGGHTGAQKVPTSSNKGRLIKVTSPCRNWQSSD